MSVHPRYVTRELLDDLDPADPRARRSREDLQRVHRAMRSVQILRHIVRTTPLADPPNSIIELGAGDGTLMLRLARSLRPKWTGIEVTLLDRHDLVSRDIRAEYRKLGWKVTVLQEDVFSWIRTPLIQCYDMCIANLFLHHFDSVDLTSLLLGVAPRTNSFITCEPRRDVVSRLASRCVGLIGGNEVTRGDAVKSVDAGFTDHELSEIWASAPGDWTVMEHRAFPFTHCFTATRLVTPLEKTSHAG